MIVRKGLRATCCGTRTVRLARVTFPLAGAGVCGPLLPTEPRRCCAAAFPEPAIGNGAQHFEMRSVCDAGQSCRLVQGLRRSGHTF